ncbi:MAG: hypothetical protein H0W18_02120 [Acidobacteria bacterium]|nr:hypothetical protein [Acidobacteriota bacterium]
MKATQTLAPLGAAATALATVLCCLPFGFAAATAMAAVSTVVAERRPWFLGASLALLVLGVVQVTRARRACVTRRAGPLVVLGVSAAIVILVVFFPQVVAGLMADWLP